MGELKHEEQYNPKAKSVLFILRKSKNAQLVSIKNDISNLRRLAKETIKNNLRKREYYSQIAFCEDMRRQLVSDIDKIDFIAEYLSECDQLANSYELLCQQVCSGSFWNLSLEELFRAIEYNKMPSKFT